MLESIVEHAAGVLKSNSAWLFIADTDPDVYRCQVSFGENGKVFSDTLASGEGVLGEIEKQACSVIIPDYQEWPGGGAAKKPESIQTLIGAPVYCEGEMKGVLLLVRKIEATPYTSNDLELAFRLKNLAESLRDSTVVERVVYCLFQVRDWA